MVQSIFVNRDILEHLLSMIEDINEESAIVLFSYLIINLQLGDTLEAIKSSQSFWKKRLSWKYNTDYQVEDWMQVYHQYRSCMIHSSRFNLMCHAIFYGYLEFLRLLYHNNSKANALSGSVSPGEQDIQQYLSTYVKSKRTNLAIILAIGSNNEGVFPLVLTHNKHILGDVDMCYQYMSTSCLLNNANVLSIMIANGADPVHKFHGQLSLLQYINMSDSKLDKTPITELLLSQECIKNDRGYVKRSMLSVVKKCDPPLLKILLDHAKLDEREIYVIMEFGDACSECRKLLEAELPEISTIPVIDFG